MEFSKWSINKYINWFQFNKLILGVNSFFFFVVVSQFSLKWWLLNMWYALHLTCVRIEKTKRRKFNRKLHVDNLLHLKFYEFFFLWLLWIDIIVVHVEYNNGLKENTNDVIELYDGKYLWFLMRLVTLNFRIQHIMHTITTVEKCIFYGRCFFLSKIGDAIHWIDFNSTISFHSFNN